MCGYMNKRSVVLRINILLVLIFVLSIIISLQPMTKTKEYNIIYVDDDGTSDYTSIQDAINAANENDTIYVYNGTYFENLIIDKPIKLIGENKQNTIIDGKSNGDVIFLDPSSNYVNISGFTIQNSGIDRYDEGINIDSDFNKIIGNIVKDCNCGMSLDYWAHNCLIQDNIFTSNNKGISVYSVFPNNNLIFHNNFVKNTMSSYDNSNGLWDYNGQGNYWDDYTGNDNNGDGIGDTPYNIPGGSTQDNYPLMKPYGTPGFELLIMIIAIAFVIIMLKRKK